MYDTGETKHLKVIANTKAYEPPFLLVEGEDVIQPVYQFLMLIYLRDFSAQTIRAYAYDLLAFYRFLYDSGLTAEELDVQNLTRFILSQRKQKAAPRTINRRLTTIQSFLNSQYNKLGDKILPSPSPVLYKGQRNTALLGKSFLKGERKRSWKLKVPTRLVDPLSHNEVQRFLAGIKKYRDLAIIYLMLLCGLRSAEVLGLEIDDIDFIENQMRVRGKGNKERILPLSNLARKTLKLYLDYERPVKCSHSKCFVTLRGSTRAKPMTKESLRMLFRYRSKITHLKKAHPHLFRHTFCTQLMTQGVSIPVVQKLMGHTDIHTTMAYTHIAYKDIYKEYHQAMETLQKNYEAD